MLPTCTATYTKTTMYVSSLLHGCRRLKNWHCSTPANLCSCMCTARAILSCHSRWLAMLLDEWAVAWGVSPAALFDLRQRMGIAGAGAMPAVVPDGKPGSEVRQQSLLRIHAAENGVWLTRNNVGALIDERGVPVRYGLANESKEQNKHIKSADLIGIRPILIGPQHLGKVIGQFVSVECKHETWKYKGDAHEVAQLNWSNFVNSKGGFACFASQPVIFNTIR